MKTSKNDIRKITIKARGMSVKNDPTRKIGVKASRKRAGWSLDYLEQLLGLK